MATFTGSSAGQECSTGTFHIFNDTSTQWDLMEQCEECAAGHFADSRGQSCSLQISRKPRSARTRSGFEEGRVSEVVFWIDELSIEFGPHWLMLLTFITPDLFQSHFAFVFADQVLAQLDLLRNLLIYLMARSSRARHGDDLFAGRKVQKLPASLISSELRAHQMSPSGVTPH